MVSRTVATLTVMGLLAVGQLAAQDAAAPKRFTPPVHAHPLRGETVASANQPLRNVRQVSAVQDFSAPPTLQMDIPSPTASPATSAPANGSQWRGRSTDGYSDSSWAAPNQTPMASRPAPQQGWEATAPQAQSSGPVPVEHSVLSRQPASNNLSSPSGDGLQDDISRLRVEPQRAQRDTYPVPSSLRSGASSNSSWQQDFGGNQGPRTTRSCEDYRDDLLNSPIEDIVIDFAPVRPNAKQASSNPVTRTWTDCHGQPLATGTLEGIERSYIIIRSSAGDRLRVPMARLGDAELALVSEYWVLPNECSLGCFPFEGRCWTPNTVLWKASSLCHKPLYFENVQLERYGHTHGPVMQPLRSTAHFFVSLITVPYQTGIHPPNECIYSLGFYRPGDCAPWLKDPIPLSLHGAGRQALVVGGMTALLP